MTSKKAVIVLGQRLVQDEICTYLYVNSAGDLSAWENLGTWRTKYHPFAMFSVHGQGDTLASAEAELVINLKLRLRKLRELLLAGAGGTPCKEDEVPSDEEGDGSLHDGDEMEGYVVRLAEEFHYGAFRRVAKYVRPNHVTSNSHWKFKQVIPNNIKPT